MQGACVKVNASSAAGTTDDALKPESEQVKSADAKSPAAVGVPPDREESRWKIAKLRSLPDYDWLFGPLPQWRIQELADRLRNRQGGRVEITPSGKIITGDEWVAAAKFLGWAEIAVLIRHDLQAQGESAIELYQIGHYLARDGELDQLTVARCCLRRHETECNIAIAAGLPEPKAKFRKEIAELLHIGSRSVARLMQLIDLPHVIQDAVSDGRLALRDACCLTRLPRDVQKEIAKQILAGGMVKSIVAVYLKKDGRHTNVPKAKAAAVRLVERIIADRGDRPDQIPYLTAKEAEVLKKGIALFEAILSKTKVLRPSAQPAATIQAEFAKLLGRNVTATSQPEAGVNA